MIFKTKWMLCLLAALMLGGAAFGQGAPAAEAPEVPDEEAIPAAVNSFMESVLAGDTAALGDLLHTSFAGVISDPMQGVVAMDGDTFAKTLVSMADGAPAGVKVELENTDIVGAMAFVEGAIKIPGEADGAMWCILTKRPEGWLLIASAVDVAPWRVPAADKEADTKAINDIVDGVAQKVFGGNLNAILDYLGDGPCVFGIAMGRQLLAMAGKDTIAAMLQSIPETMKFTLDEASDPNIVVGAGVAVATMDISFKMNDMPMNVRAFMIGKKVDDDWKLVAALATPLEAEE